MSWQPCPEPACDDGRGAVDLVIAPHEKDLGGFTVRRVLPRRATPLGRSLRLLRPHGPGDLSGGRRHRRAAAPAHRARHRDLPVRRRDPAPRQPGDEQPIRPGAVNWMTAGRGIVHSERTAQTELARPRRLHGIQTWVALPRDARGDRAGLSAPSRPRRLPVFEDGDARLRLIAGSAFGRPRRSRRRSTLFYVEAHVAAGGKLDARCGARRTRGLPGVRRARGRRPGVGAGSDGRARAAAATSC